MKSRRKSIVSFPPLVHTRGPDAGPDVTAIYLACRARRAGLPPRQCILEWLAIRPAIRCASGCSRKRAGDHFTSRRDCNHPPFARWPSRSRESLSELLIIHSKLLECKCGGAKSAAAEEGDEGQRGEEGGGRGVGRKKRKERRGCRGRTALLHSRLKKRIGS